MFTFKLLPKVAPGSRSDQEEPLLPAELLAEIAKFLFQPSDLVNFCLASRIAYTAALPVLWTSLSFNGGKCQMSLESLLHRPERTMGVKKLFLRPGYLREPTPETLAQESLISNNLDALLPNFHSLQTFVWDGLEAPDEKVWKALLESCKQIRHINTTITEHQLSEDSALFSFSDLVAFSLATKYKWRGHQGFRDVVAENFPAAMWDMLIDRCPHLQELALGGPGTSLTTRLFNARRLCKGRWPQLQSVSLGHVLLYDRELPAFDQDEDINSFKNFIRYHRKTLKRLQLPYSTKIPQLTSENLELESFSGNIPYLIDLLPLDSLRELILCSEEHAAWYIPYLRRVLLRFPALTTLVIWINLSSRIEDPTVEQDTDHIRIFYSILQTCPNLHHFKVLCSTKTKRGFQMKDFHKALKDGPNLRTLEVYKVYTLGEEDMVQSAANIVRQLPSLEQIILRYTTDPWSFYERMVLRQTGIYQTVYGKKSKEPVRLSAREEGAGLFKRFSRKYEHNLVPLRTRMFSGFNNDDD